MLRLKSLIALFIVSWVFFSCGSGEERPRLDENGLTPEINRLVSQEYLDALVDLGFVINRGGTPPILSGQFRVSPCYIAKSTAGDIQGISTRDFFLNLYDQKELTITVDFKQQSQEGNDIGSYIVGADDKFSIFVEVSELNTNTGARAKVLYAISGKKTSEGISDIKIANLMLDNFGNPNKIWIPNGTGRVFMDRDNLASPIQ
ncbi:hypothetical protein D0X99_16375 [Algoriphagus lacus]|uniref:Uncharacterized protein n=1 Tax=Algoriphagus lacus TaxID=2056311 RepID=A0A418PNU6_9BACT|nr:hypothetical protein [Algoriphagus lacus]RIW13351.1 hypothetical protein D0X99_16375 [Algoriphagus lacus]